MEARKKQKATLFSGPWLALACAFAFLASLSAFANDRDNYCQAYQQGGVKGCLQQANLQGLVSPFQEVCEKSLDRNLSIEQEILQNRQKVKNHVAKIKADLARVNAGSGAFDGSLNVLERSQNGTAALMKDIEDKTKELDEILQANAEYEKSEDIRRAKEAARPRPGRRAQLPACVNRSLEVLGRDHRDIIDRSKALKGELESYAGDLRKARTDQAKMIDQLKKAKGEGGNLGGESERRRAQNNREPGKKPDDKTKAPTNGSGGLAGGNGTGTTGGSIDSNNQGGATGVADSIFGGDDVASDARYREVQAAIREKMPDRDVRNGLTDRELDMARKLGTETPTLADSKAYVKEEFGDPLERMRNVARDAQREFANGIPGSDPAAAANAVNEKYITKMQKEYDAMCAGRMNACERMNLRRPELLTERDIRVNYPNNTAGASVGAGEFGSFLPTDRGDPQFKLGNIPVPNTPNERDAFFAVFDKKAGDYGRDVLAGANRGIVNAVGGTVDLVKAGQDAALTKAADLTGNETIGRIAERSRNTVAIGGSQNLENVANSVGIRTDCGQTGTLCNVVAGTTEATVGLVGGGGVAKGVGLVGREAGLVGREAGLAGRELTGTATDVANAEAAAINRSAKSAARVDESVVRNNAALDDAARTGAIREQLPQLNDRQVQAVMDAHTEVRGEVGTFTRAELREKAELMRDAGIDRNSRREAIERGLAGDAPGATGATTATRQEARDVLSEAARKGFVQRDGDNIIIKNDRGESITVPASRFAELRNANASAAPNPTAAAVTNGSEDGLGLLRAVNRQPSGGSGAGTEIYNPNKATVDVVRSSGGQARVDAVDASKVQFQQVGGMREAPTVQTSRVDSRPWDQRDPQVQMAKIDSTPWDSQPQQAQARIAREQVWGQESQETVIRNGRAVAVDSSSVQRSQVGGFTPDKDVTYAAVNRADHRAGGQAPVVRDGQEVLVPDRSIQYQAVNETPRSAPQAHTNLDATNSRALANKADDVDDFDFTKPTTSPAANKVADDLDDFDFTKTTPNRAPASTGGARAIDLSDPQAFRGLNGTALEGQTVSLGSGNSVKVGPKLGEGSAGSVYDIGNGQVIKVANSEYAVASLKQELALASKLEQAGIPTVPIQGGGGEAAYLIKPKLNLKGVTAREIMEGSGLSDIQKKSLEDLYRKMKTNRLNLDLNPENLYWDRSRNTFVMLENAPPMSGRTVSNHWLNEANFRKRYFNEDFD